MFSHRSDFLRHLAQTSPEPMGLEIVSAKGLYLKGIDGKRYLDLISGISVNALGHQHPLLIKAIQKQSRKFSHVMVYGEMVQGPQVRFAKLLCSCLPEPLQTVYFVNSGTEATEAAMKLAKRATGRSGFVSFHQSYHGSTQGALSLMGGAYFTDAYLPLLPDIQHARYEEPESLNAITEKTAAVFIETVRAEAGAIPVSIDFLKKIQAKCKETGALLVLDEIQTGLGRTGTLFSMEQSGIVPDVLLLAKSLGGGLPLGAFISSPELMGTLSHKPVLGHLTTFGGHPLSCATGYAQLAYIRKQRLWEMAQERSAEFREKVAHERIQKINGLAWLMGLEFDRSQTNFAILRKALELGLVSDWFLFNDRSLRVAPALTIGSADIKKAVGIIHRAIEAVDGLG